LDPSAQAIHKIHIGCYIVETVESNDQPQYLSVGETASRLGVHPNTVRNWVKDGILKSARVAGSRFHRFDATEVERLARSRGASVAPIQETRRNVGPELVDATQLHGWAGRRGSQGLLPRLVRRLLLATPGVGDLAMRAGEGIASEGWDGLVHAEVARPPVPAGPSAWELSVRADVRTKAQEDYDKRTANPLGVDPAQTTFVFLTARRWVGAAEWETERRAEKVWRDVRVIDADQLEMWLEATPGVHVWISEQLGLQPQDAETVERWWQRFADRADPSVPAELLLAGRQEATDRLRTFVASDPAAIGVAATWRDEAIAFVAASLGAAGGEEHAAAEPVVVVSARPAWNRLTQSTSPMTLLPEFDEPDIGTALSRGHHVVIPIGQGDLSRGTVIKLPRLDRNDARTALMDGGINDFRKADELAALARRSLASFMRLRARDPRMARPQWSQHPASDIIAPLVLVGSWSPTDADHEVVAEVVGRSWDDIATELQAWVRSEDPPFTRSGGRWHLTAPEEAYSVLEGALLDSHFERWASVVLRVLGETDPMLELAVEERPFTANKRTYSGALRNGLAESLALLGALGHQSHDTGPTQADRAAILVRELLERANADASGLLWRSLAEELPRLAEAAPQPFLDAVEAGVAGDQPLLGTMFRDSERNSLFNTSSPHTGLLWALELLCWPPDYFLSAVRLIGRLAEIDPGGRLANRPPASLRAALLPWLPYTAAPLELRLEAVTQLCEQYPAVGWRLLLSLLPQGHDTSMPTSSPRFRDWKPDREGVLVSEWVANVTGLVTQAIERADNDPHQWAELVEHLGPLPPDQRNRLLNELDRLSGLDLSDDAEGQLALWEKLTNEAARHRQFPKAQWSMDEASLTRMEGLAAALEAPDVIERHARLFGWRPDLPGFDPYDHEAGDRVLREARAAAIEDTLSTAGPDGLLRLATKSVRQDQVGWAAAEVRGQDIADTVIAWLETEGVPRAVAVGWVARMAAVDDSWAASQGDRLKALSPDGQASFLLALPPGSMVWPLLEQVDEAARATYWRYVEPLRFSPEDVEIATDQLIAHARPWAAITLLTLRLHAGGGQPTGVTIELVTKALDAGLTSGTADSARVQSPGYDIGMLLDFLAAQGYDVASLARLEFAYFKVTEYDRAPYALYASLADDPERFVELVSTVYRGKSERKRQLNELDAQAARNAWSVLNSWRRPPGVDDQGNLDIDHLRTWVRQARIRFAELDRTDIGDEQVGQLLSGSPEGSDGAWPAESVRDLIEEIGSRELENGVHVGVINGRGITSRDVYSGGGQERDLSARYLSAANAAARWPRTARLLRSLADDYERQARHWDADAEQNANV
jgi:excisionase family DNA binding protein